MNASVELRRTLNRVGDRVRRLRLWGGLAVCWAACALVGVVGVVARPDVIAPRDVALLLAAVAVAVGMTWWLIVGRMARDPRWLARRIEAKNPDLSAALLAAVEQEPTPDGRLGFLQSSVIESALAHSRTHDWDQAVPRSRLTSTFLAHGLAFLAFVVVVGLIGFRTVAPTDGSNTPTLAAATASGLAVEVEPGNAEIERGTALLVIAKFPTAVPPEVTLVVEGAAAKPMARNLDDPAFAGHVPAVDAPLVYRVEFPGGRSDTFRVTVYEHPELRRVDARLVFPPYTGLDPKDVQDVRHISAVEGTEITLLCRMNKAVTAAVLLDEKKRELPLVLHDADQHVYRATLKPADSQRYQVRLTDADGRINKLPADISVRVTRNLPPVVTVPRPGRDSRVSPLEELPLKADVKDDFGLVRFGVSVTAFGQPPTEVVLGEPVQPNVKKAQPDHLIDFEALKAQPDQMVAYYFWAEDVGPDGKRRRTSGDMYFAEVRHFEEIFRQGEQQTREQQERQQQQQQQQGGGNAEQADQLAELQKQIVNATWRLIRRETGTTPTDKFAEDMKLVRESQQALIEKAESLGEKIQNPASAEHLRQAIQFMTAAEKQLAEGTIPGLPAALAAEQAAYQALLKLRAREFEVTRQNSRQRQQGNRGANSRSPSQRQLNQLDLTDEQNRYETQSAARAQQERQAQRDREQRENQDLADRLKELARRQNDLTDRVKELQAALEQAKDEKKKEELQQQLKRLRDQQQQVLRDTDELQQRMEQEQNRDRLSDARQQVEQSRENVRQAAEALEKGQLGQAVNEGTRAGRQLDAVRDQLRKESANRFGEEMRELRGQARQLDEEQQKLTKQLDDMKQTPKPGLGDGGVKEKVQQGLAEQKKQLDQLTERLQKTVQEAEQPEPVLAQELYNTVRGAAEEKVGDTIDLARRLSAAGGTADAAEASRKAGQGTERLRKGVEKAAEGVLGGQTEALKRAQRELDELAEQVNREVAQATGQQQPGQRPGEKPGERPDQKGQPGQGQPGERLPNQQQPGPGQPGERQPGQQPGQGEQQRQPGQQPGQGQPGQQQPGERGQPQQPGERGQQPGQQPNQPGQPGGQRRSLTDPPERNERGQPGGQERAGGERTQPGPQTGGVQSGPIREEGFRQWYDRMRAAEDLLDDPKLRAEAARIRDRVRTTREEFKRHAKEPDWKQLQEMVAKPLNELRDRVAEEVRKRDTPDALVPIDRDPVPPEFIDGVRRYYERLGSGR